MCKPPERFLHSFQRRIPVLQVSKPDNAFLEYGENCVLTSSEFIQQRYFYGGISHQS